MVKHVVMFKFKPEVEAENRCRYAIEFKRGIEQLPAVIDCIRMVRVGVNMNENEKWDICLESEFDSLDDVKTYSVHPSHKAVAMALMAHIAERACVDFEF